MTPNRAQSILNSSLNGSLSMTDAERASVQKAQVYNPNSNFLNVLLKIAEGVSGGEKWGHLAEA